MVEDEYFLADDVARALRAAGAEVLGPLDDPDAVLRFIEEEARIDLAVLDINLRGALIYPVAEELRRRRIPFVFATGYDRSAIPAEYRDVPRWEKPFDLAELVRALPEAAARP